MRPEKKNNQLNEGTDRKATFDYQLSGSHRPAAFLSLCPWMNLLQGSVALSADVALRHWVSIKSIRYKQKKN